jgi:Uma2 family endonuclease
MSTTLTSPPGVPSAVDRITVESYERMVDAGVLDNVRVELLGGRLVPKMPKNPRHVFSTFKLAKALEGVIPPGWHVRTEGPVRIPEYDEPEPDVAVVIGTLEDYLQRHPAPAEVVVLVEVAESTLAFDRAEKLSAYAAGGILVYWIVNLVDRQVEVYSLPTPDGYQARQDFRCGQEVPVIVAGNECGRIAVAAIIR